MPSFTQSREEFVEEYLIQLFRNENVEEKQPFFSKCFTYDVSLANQPFPLDVNLFNEETKLVISMLIQLLGIDAYKFLPGVLMSMLLKISMSQSESYSPQPPCLKFDEFLDENIHSQLVNFHNAKDFRFHPYLIRMFYFSMKKNYISQRCYLQQRSVITFSNI